MSMSRFYVEVQQVVWRCSKNFGAFHLTGHDWKHLMTKFGEGIDSYVQHAELLGDAWGSAMVHRSPRLDIEKNEKITHSWLIFSFDISTPAAGGD